MAGYLHQEHVCISRAVDTVELLCHAFVKNLEIENIAVGNEELIRDEGQKSNFSSIGITVREIRSK